MLLLLLLLLLFWFAFEAESYFVGQSGLEFATRSSWPWTSNPSTFTQLLGCQACATVPSWLVDLYLTTAVNSGSWSLCRSASCVMTSSWLGLLASEVLVTYMSSCLLKHAHALDLPENHFLLISRLLWHTLSSLQSLNYSSPASVQGSRCPCWKELCWPWELVCVIIRMSLKYHICLLRTTLYYLWNHIISMTKLSKILLLSPPVITEVLTHHRGMLLASVWLRCALALSLVFHHFYVTFLSFLSSWIASF